jgi:pyruvate kinase
LAKKNSTDSARQDDMDIEHVLIELAAIRADMVADLALSQRHLARIHPNYQDSARNLLHYLALRRRDLRPLQLRLAALGLSSLGQAESHVLATVDEVLSVLHRLLQRAVQPVSGESAIIDFSHGERLLTEHTNALLGEPTMGRKVRIMVTMPSEAADDYLLVHNLLQQGMDCMRINCAHDDATAWARMIAHLRQAEQSLGRSCRVVMDLAGPKLRTGPLEPGPAVLRIRPVRDVYGRVSAPARVWLSAENTPQPPPSLASAHLPVPSDWLGQLRVGERVP